MLVVSLRGVNFGFWSHLGCSGQNAIICRETKYFKQEPIQRRFDFSGVLYFGWPSKPSSGTMRVYIGLLLCT